jgi:hypothetical protein
MKGWDKGHKWAGASDRGEMGISTIQYMPIHWSEISLCFEAMRRRAAKWERSEKAVIKRFTTVLFLACSSQNLFLALFQFTLKTKADDSFETSISTYTELYPKNAVILTFTRMRTSDLNYPLRLVVHIFVSRQGAGSSVGRATSHWVDGWGSRNIFPSPHSSDLLWGPSGFIFNGYRGVFRRW